MNGSTANGTNGAGLFPPPGSRLREQVRAALAASGLSQARAAREIGVSDSALSQWLAAKYQGDAAAVDGKVGRWLKSREERASLARRLPEAPEWTPTPTARRIEAGLSYAQLAGDVTVIYGGAGVGKTLAARRYAATRPNVWIAAMTPAVQALGPCLERLALACGLRPTNGRPARLEVELRDRLTGSQGLLIVDEAQHLSPRALEGVRSLHDATSVGLALLGNETIYSRLTGGRRAAEFAQLFSRIGKRVRLTTAAKGDVEALMAAWQIEDAAMREAALEIARQPGALRGLTKALRLATLFAKGGPLEAQHVAAAWKDLGGGAA